MNPLTAIDPDRRAGFVLLSLHMAAQTAGRSVEFHRGAVHRPAGCLPDRLLDATRLSHGQGLFSTEAGSIVCAKYRRRCCCSVSRALPLPDREPIWLPSAFGQCHGHRLAGVVGICLRLTMLYGVGDFTPMAFIPRCPRALATGVFSYARPGPYEAPCESWRRRHAPCDGFCPRRFSSRRCWVGSICSASLQPFMVGWSASRFHRRGDCPC